MLRGEESFVVLGRHYEHLVQRMLARIGINCRMVGGRNDGGVDLQGTWLLSNTHKVPIFVQCKRLARACPPVYVRELEGALARADEGAVAILASSSMASKATLDAIHESISPLLFLHFDKVFLRRAFANPTLMQHIPNLAIATRHIPSLRLYEPVFYYNHAPIMAVPLNETS